MKCSLGISDFLEEISSLSHSIVFLYFFALITEEGFLIFPCYSLELCIQMDISFLFSFVFSLQRGFLQRPNNKCQTNKKIIIFKKWNWIETYLVSLTHKQRLGYSALSICPCSVTKWYPTLRNPMDCSLPVLPVLHHLPEFAQTHVHWVKDAIQPSHHLSPLSPALNLSQHQGRFQWVSSSHQVAQLLELQHQSFEWIFRVDFPYWKFHPWELIHFSWMTFW